MAAPRCIFSIKLFQKCCQIHLGPDGRIADYECQVSSCIHCMAQPTVD
jgi:hypothetical protein